MSRVFDDLPREPRETLTVRCYEPMVTTELAFTALGAPNDDYSRTCWLRVLGPTAWVLWGTLAADGAVGSAVVYDVGELTDALGLGRPQRLMKALKRLDRLGIADKPHTTRNNAWRIPAVTPPLRTRELHSLGATARAFHHTSIANLTDTDQHLLHEGYPSTYADHFGQNHY